ncbi:HNH endonuclease [Pseudomonas sp. GXM4]|uniref:HNH endonuclease n=1 Tax=Pseudomonas sp. GXM4 TaxID=2651867 RepID=UPI00124E9BBD|nr:hypothetical protein [Pseudomonas sp. GXM4]KAB2519086.1 HNH endonuclease [Pseudomonas sp. GXM4]
MADAYHPRLTEINLTDDEVTAIQAALASSSPWKVEGEHIQSAKNKLRDFHLLRHEENCCYCRMNLHGLGHFTIDREHILPKGKDRYRSLSYTVWNLSASCKRCNMQYKGEDDDFVLDKKNSVKYQRSENYLIVHPSFDEWEQHLSRESKQVNRKNMVKFTIVDGSAKGQYTYDYFNLMGLEVDSFTSAQAVNLLGRREDSEAGIEVRSLAAKHGQ